MKKSKARNAAKGKAKAMVLTPLYRTRVTKSLAVIKSKRLNKTDLLTRLEDAVDR